MSVAVQTLLPNNRFHHHRCFYTTHIHLHYRLKTHLFPLPISTKHTSIPLQFQILGHKTPFTTIQFPLKALESDGFAPNQAPTDLNLDAFLSVAEVLCLAPSAILSIASAVNWTFFSSQKWFQVSVMNKVLVWQAVLLVGAAVFGVLIRRRQWNRICVGSGKSGGSSFNLLDRIEKLEEDLRSSATIIRVLSRQVEKLGIRFRVTRKTLKDPITETAALAQKNSEATRVLAAQEDILEKELGEIQNILLAMQEQQQKQLELILTIGKAGKLKDILQEPVVEKESIGVSKSVEENDGAKPMNIQTAQTENIHKGGSNDRP